MKTLLLLTCGTNACYHIAKTLKEYFPREFRIVGTDINLQWLIPTSPYLDVYFQCPYTTNENYYSYILHVCKEERVDFLLPSFDADQNLFYAENEDLLKLGVKSFGISRDIKDIYCSKSNTNDYLKSIGLPIPREYGIDEIEPDKTYFVKPKNGVGSVGARKSLGLELLQNPDSDLLVQEVCLEPEITLECFNYKGEVFSVARKRLGCKAGVCTKTHIFQSQDLANIAKKFARSIPLPYIFNLQFMLNTKGQYVITDVNLRPAGGMSLSHTAGWDEVSALARIMLGSDNVTETIEKKITDQYIIRAYTDIVTKNVSRRIGFDLDGTLLDSRNRHMVLMKDILYSKGIDLDVSDIVSFKADGYNNLDWLAVKGVSTDKAEDINKEWISKIESKEYLQADKLYPDTIEMLRDLSARNSIFLITARRNKENALDQIHDLGITQFFDEIMVVPSGEKTTSLKSDFIKKKEIEVFIGDTEVDMNAAKIAGCEFEVRYHGFRSYTFWQQYNVKEFDKKRY